jgi:hypothetical protein
MKHFTFLILLSALLTSLNAIADTTSTDDDGGEEEVARTL